MTPVMDSNGTSARHQYRRVSDHQMDDRRLLLRGGECDGKIWVGVVAVGQRVFCGDGAWSTSGVYVVTDSVVINDDGDPVTIAVPAFAADVAVDR